MEDPLTDQEEFKSELKEYEKAEEDLCKLAGPHGSSWPYQKIWYELEKLRSERLWRPVRDLTCEVSF